MDSHILTANRLSDGRVVVRTADGWSPRPEDALRLPPTDLEALPPVKGAALVGVRSVAVDGEGVPRLLRERIRFDGPTVPFGVQAEGA